MLCNLYDAKGLKKLLSFECLPICQVDFCETCGDCLCCYVEDGCGGDPDAEHFWVLNLNKAKAFLVKHQVDQSVGEKIGAEIRKGKR